MCTFCIFCTFCTFCQGSLLLILRGGSLPLKYSNFQQFDKKLSQFDKKLRTGLIRLKVTSNPTLPKGQKPKLHLTTTCQTDKNGKITVLASKIIEMNKMCTLL